MNENKNRSRRERDVFRGKPLEMRVNENSITVEKERQRASWVHNFLNGCENSKKKKKNLN